MTPYSDLLFFYILGLLLLPAIVLGLLQKPLRHYGLAATAAVLAFLFSQNAELPALLAFYFWQIALCFFFLRVSGKSRPKLWIAVILSLTPLILTKLGAVFGPANLFQLLGVSYMTFRAVGVLLDIHDGKLSRLDLAALSYFLLFFPSVSSGPIDRYRRFLDDLSRRLSLDEYLEMLRRGVWKLFFGAFSSIVLSGLIWRLWLEPLPGNGLLATLSYMYGYTFFLFFNFAGYISMAIGTAYILGVSLPENFNMPFLSVDMKDFWSRWHISLSTWLRDYLYTRFVMRSLKASFFKNQRTASYIGYLLTMTAMGAWHGITPAYLVYGVYHGLLMCVNEALDLHWKPFRRMKRSGWGQACLVAVTFHLFSFGLLIFSGRLV